MAETPVSYASGTTTPTVNVENFLSQVNTAGVFNFTIDTTNMAAGDVLVVRVYDIALHNGSSNVLYVMVYYGVQPSNDIIKTTPPIGNDLSDATALQFSINQTFGIARAYPWKVLQF